MGAGKKRLKELAGSKNGCGHCPLIAQNARKRKRSGAVLRGACVFSAQNVTEEKSAAGAGVKHRRL